MTKSIENYYREQLQLALLQNRRLTHKVEQLEELLKEQERRLRIYNPSAYDTDGYDG